MTHNNSRKITILRSNNFVISAQSGEAVMDFVGLSSKNIGPYWESVDAGIMGSGLTIAEQDLLMPVQLSMSTEDKDYRKKIFDFFNMLTTKIPPTTGKDLEIGLEQSNDQPLSKDNMPLNVNDYIRYRHAKAHPWVAGSQLEAKGNQLKVFYIHDTETQQQEDNARIVLQDQAAEIYLQIKSQSGKVDQLLIMLGLDPRDYAGKNSVQIRQQALRKIVDEDAPRFLKVYKTDKFETRYWLKAMIAAGQVKEIGTSLVIAQNDKLLGRSEAEAVLYLEDPANDDTIAVLKANTQEVLAKPRTSRRPKTIATRS